MKVNRNFKSSVFTTLFDNPDLLRELYCALEGVYLPPDAPVSINTLKNVLYMDLYNDISFVINGKLVVLIEQQSTRNPNMALRLLLYISEVYEGMLDDNTIYSTTPVCIPWPEFFVLYNGRDEFPDEEIVRLSDLFEKPQDLGLSEKAKPLLELEARVININEGKNEIILNRCKKLQEYSVFIAKAHAFWKETGDLKKGIKAAIKYCRKHGILEEFLKKYAREVLSMLHMEWNLEDAVAFARKEGIGIGVEKGIGIGVEKSKQYVIDLLNQGLTTEEIKQRLTQADKR